MGCSFTNTRGVCIYTSYNRTHIENAYIYIYMYTELLDGNKGHQEETHHPAHRFWRLFLDLLSMGWRGCTSAMGAIKLPPSCSISKIMCQSIYILSITYAVEDSHKIYQLHTMEWNRNRHKYGPFCIQMFIL